MDEQKKDQPYWRYWLKKAREQQLLGLEHRCFLHPRTLAAMIRERPTCNEDGFRARTAPAQPFKDSKCTNFDYVRRWHIWQMVPDESVPIGQFRWE